MKLTRRRDRAVPFGPDRQHPSPELDRAGHCDDDVIEDQFLDLLDVPWRQSVDIERRQFSRQFNGKIFRHATYPRTVL